MVTDRRLTTDTDRVDIFVSPSTGHVVLEVCDVSYEAKAVRRRLRVAQKTLFDFHLSHYRPQQLPLNSSLCIFRVTD